jgi:DNA-binding transcriptional LysR family regulator
MVTPSETTASILAYKGRWVIILFVTSDDTGIYQMAGLNDWELLRVLLETARAGGFRRAEAKLGMTQPTIGKKIDRLEKVVGSKLLVRTKSGVSLTPAGEEMARIAESMEKLAEKASRGNVPQAAKSSGRIRVALTDAMAGYWLPRRLKRFHTEYPNITLDVKCIEFGAQVDLSGREADITVMYKYPTDLDVVVLQEAVLELAPMCTTAFARDWGIPTSIADVVHFPVVAQSVHYHKIGSMKPWADMLEHHPMVIYRTTSSVVLALVARMGIGISLQPVGVVDREEGVMLLELDGGFRVYLPFYLVCHKNVKDVPAVRAVIDYLQNSIFEDDGMGSPSKSLRPPEEKVIPDVAEAGVEPRD